MKKVIIIAIAVVLCLSVIGGVFAVAVYSKTPDDVTITISTGGAATLTITGTGNDSIAPGAANKIEKQITLDDNVVAALSGQATLTVVIADVSDGELAQYLDVTFQKTDSTFTTPDGAAVSEATLTGAGQQYSLSTIPVYGKLIIQCNATDEQFADVSGDQVTITVHWNYVEFAPVDDTWYLIGNNTGWRVTSAAIALTDPKGEDKAVGLNKSIKAGNWKAVHYEASKLQATDTPYSTMEWSSGDDFVISSDGSYNIYVNSSYGLYINAVS